MPVPVFASAAVPRINSVGCVIIIVAVAVIAIVAVGAVAYIVLIPPPAPDEIRYGVLLPGSITDSGWNAAMYIATQEAETILGIDFDITYGVGSIGAEDVFGEYHLPTTI